MTAGPTAGVLAADDAFFAALLAGDVRALAALLAEDFLIVDVLGGQVTDRATMLDAIGSGVLRFTRVDRDPERVTVRHRPGIGVVVGHTVMTMSFGGTATTVHSRYTHVFSDAGGVWHLLAAQGTPVAEG